MKMVRDYPVRSFSLLIFLIAISAGVIAIRRNFYGRYTASVIDMALGFTARNLCSCYFVQEKSEAHCRETTEIDQLSPTFTIDSNRRAVISKYLFWHAEAQISGPTKAAFSNN